MDKQSDAINHVNTIIYLWQIQAYPDYDNHFDPRHNSTKL